MKSKDINKLIFKEYLQNNEVVFQTLDGLIEVANDIEKENKVNIIEYLDKTASIDIYEKDHMFIKDNFSDLNNWSLKEDVLFLLQPVGVLVCISKKDALKNALIVA